MPSLFFENRSRNVVTACLYQTITSPPPGAAPVAWLTSLTQVEGFWRVVWDLSLNYVWSQEQLLPGGDPSTTGQVLRAGVAAGTSVPLTRSNGSLAFGAIATGAPAGTLVINQDDLVPRNARAGIGMNGSATILAPTQPNLPLAFAAASRTWLTVGSSYPRGTVMPAAPKPVQELVFDPGVDALYVSLGDDNTLTPPIPISSARTALLRYASWKS